MTDWSGEDQQRANLARASILSYIEQLKALFSYQNGQSRILARAELRLFHLFLEAIEEAPENPEFYTGARNQMRAIRTRIQSLAGARPLTNDVLETDPIRNIATVILAELDLIIELYKKCESKKNA